jgi:hypothetical protein
MFCIVFCILNAIFVSSNRFVIYLVSFPPYVKVAHFFGVEGQYLYPVSVRLDVFYFVYIVQCLGHLISSDHQLYNVMPLKMPFRLLIRLVQSSPTRNYNHSQLFLTLSHLHSLQLYTFVTTITYYTVTLADFSAINYCLKLSQTLHLHTSKLSPRTYSTNSLLETAT